MSGETRTVDLEHEAERAQMQRRFFDLVSEKMERGAVAYGDRSYSRDPDALIREIEDELADVCGWAAVLYVRLERAREALRQRQTAGNGQGDGDGEERPETRDTERVGSAGGARSEG